MKFENDNPISHHAAQIDSSVRFIGVEGITGISAPHVAHAQSFNQDVDLFNKGIEKIAGFTPVAGPSITSGLCIAMATGSPLLGGLTATGVAIHTMCKGSKGPTRS